MDNPNGECRNHRYLLVYQEKLSGMIKMATGASPWLRNLKTINIEDHPMPKLLKSSNSSKSPLMGRRDIPHDP
jgi:hypothetical protein